MNSVGGLRGRAFGLAIIAIPVVTIGLLVARCLELQLLDVELREAGLVLNLDLRAGPGVLMPPSMARIAITDDAGTAYRASAQSQGGWPGRVRDLVSGIPSPPAGAGNLMIRFEEFVDPPFPHMSRPVTGPWTFSVALPRE